MMWPFTKKKKDARRTADASPVLQVCLDEEEICDVHAEEVPVEKLPVARLSRSGHRLRFLDRAGACRSYDLSSIYEEGGRFLHLSVRVGPTFAVQPDGLVTTDGKNPEHVLEDPEGKGVRLEPFFLPESSGDSADLVGRGMFQRGLHYPGTVTPGNVSLLCICDHCDETFRLQSFHAGFSELTYLYCSEQPHTLVASARLPDAPPVLGEAETEAVARFESRLPPCERCGGEFRYLNPLRCPHCAEPYIDFGRHPADRPGEYYGNYLYGESLQHWEPGNDASPQSPGPG